MTIQCYYLQNTFLNDRFISNFKIKNVALWNYFGFSICGMDCNRVDLFPVPGRFPSLRVWPVGGLWASVEAFQRLAKPLPQQAHSQCRKSSGSQPQSQLQLLQHSSLPGNANGHELNTTEAGGDGFSGRANPLHLGSLAFRRRRQRRGRGPGGSSHRTRVTVACNEYSYSAGGKVKPWDVPWVVPILASNDADDDDDWEPSSSPLLLRFPRQRFFFIFWTGDIEIRSDVFPSIEISPFSLLAG